MYVWVEGSCAAATEIANVAAAAVMPWAFQNPRGFSGMIVFARALG